MALRNTSTAQCANVTGIKTKGAAQKLNHGINESVLWYTASEVCESARKTKFEKQSVENSYHQMYKIVCSFCEIRFFDTLSIQKFSLIKNIRECNNTYTVYFKF